MNIVGMLPVLAAAIALRLRFRPVSLAPTRVVCVV